MLKILTFSLLYPNACQPSHGIFVEQRLRKLVESGEVEARVVAPVPWFPSSHRAFGRYGRYAAVPLREMRHDISVIHPRFPSIPKIGMNLAPTLVAGAMHKVLKGIIADGYDFDLIDAHYFYPDGVAATMLGRALNKPVVVTCRGDDVLQFPRFRRPRQLILEGAQRAAGLVTVSGDLKNALCELGVPAHRITVLRNGVDLKFFRPPADRQSVRRALGIDRPTLLSVGHLIERKGHHFAVAALQDLPGFKLVVVGERGTEAGVMDTALKEQVRRLGLSDRVRFVGSKSHAELRDYYGAADALVLATAREGMPNVMLESLGCGTPVIATSAGGIPEILNVPEAGAMMRERTSAAVAESVRELFSRYPRREDTRRYAETLGWDATTRGQIALFERILGARRSAPQTRQVAASTQ
ncbi:MAG TPA: glycosyltransferase [Gammaproteobacteria bacterium]|nr:glycosyltransferase [Gammaproteobacteria bacterium]